MQKQKVVNAFTEGAHDSKSKRNDVSKMDSKELSFGGVGLGLSKLLAGGKSARESIREKVEEEKEVMDD